MFAYVKQNLASLIKITVLALILFLVGVRLSSWARPVSAATTTFLVNRQGDQPDDLLEDYVCDIDASTTTEECTLRAAIQQGNYMVTDAILIHFRNDVIIISPNSELPAVDNDNGVTIYADHLVYLLGTNASGYGLTLASDYASVMGLVISGFSGGVEVTGNHATVGVNGDGVDDDKERNVIINNSQAGVHLEGDYNVVAGNYIGVSTSGGSAAGNGYGIWVNGDHNHIGSDANGTSDTLERNVIAGNDTYGIVIAGDDTAVWGNYIGLNSSGDDAIPNGNVGVLIADTSSSVQIGGSGSAATAEARRNVISGNDASGILSGGGNVTISGNYIGLNAAGTAVIANDGDGVRVQDLPASSSLLIGTDGDGAGDSEEGNLISGNTEHGIRLNGDIAYAVIAGNIIGAESTGTVAHGNGGDGVHLENGATHTRIGVRDTANYNLDERNLISGNGGAGVYITGATSDFNQITGNYIGVNIYGSAALGNAAGIQINDGANGTIGSATQAELGNVVSGNSSAGITLEDVGNVSLYYNVIGMDAAQSANVGNWGHGVTLTNTADISLWRNTIAYNSGDGLFLTEASHNMQAQSNTITHNGGHGLFLTEASHTTQTLYNTITHNDGAGMYLSATAGTGNSNNANIIFENGGLGVDLAPSGVNPNDPDDADSGPNNLMNYPEFTRLVKDAASVVAEGVLDSEPNMNVEITFTFVDACDPSGYGEGGDGHQEGSSFQTDANGDLFFSRMIVLPVNAADYLVMNTPYSEYSECRLIESVENAEPTEVSISDASLAEGDSGSAWMDFDVSLNHSSPITVSVSWGVSDGTATLGEDYAVSGGAPLVFSPGVLSQTVQVEILGDTVLEPHETFYVNLHDPSHTQLGDSQATGLILDDDGGGYVLFLPLLMR
jgi:titin